MAAIEKLHILRKKKLYYMDMPLHWGYFMQTLMNCLE